MRDASFLVIVSAAVLMSCGGGDGDGSQPPTLAVALSTPTETIVVPEGEIASFGFTATYSGRSRKPVVADVSIGGSQYSLKGITEADGNSFNVDFETLPLMPGGKTTSAITFRLCTTASCETVYPGSTQSFDVTLDFQLDDWGTFQRNPAHTAYVAAQYDPARFEEKWTYDWNWDVGAWPTQLATSATRGQVFVSVPRPNGWSVKSLDAVDGSERWNNVYGTTLSATAPSYANGRVFWGQLLEPGVRRLSVIGGSDGAPIRALFYAGAKPNFLQPTVEGDQVYIAADSDTNSVLSFDYVAGRTLWQLSELSEYIRNGETVAVDADYVYFFSGDAMNAIDRNTGQIAFSMQEPDFELRSATWESAPILDGNGRIFGFSAATTVKEDSRISGYSTASREKIWMTDARYTTAAAYAHGRLLAARHESPLIDAIDPADGSVEFSLAVPGDEIILSNIVVAGSLLFVSSNARIYAFDLSQPDHPVMWQIDGPADWLAISPDNLLLASSRDKLRAISLHSPS